MPYVATVNVPGYLPMDDDPPVFDTPAGAWSYLNDMRSTDEDNAATEDEEDYSDTVFELRDRMNHHPAPGTVYGDTPGYDGDHDLGLAYTVTETISTDGE